MVGEVGGWLRRRWTRWFAGPALVACAVVYGTDRHDLTAIAGWGETASVAVVVFAFGEAAGKPVRSQRARTVKHVLLIAVGFALVALLSVLPVPGWIVDYPGSVHSIDVSPSATVPAPDIRAVTVSERPLTAFSWLTYSRGPAATVTRDRSVDVDPAVVRDTVATEAIVAAMRSVDVPATLTGGTLIVARHRGSHFGGDVAAGDRLVAIDGRPVRSFEDYLAALASPAVQLTFDLVHRSTGVGYRVTTAHAAISDGMSWPDGPSIQGFPFTQTVALRSAETAGIDVATIGDSGNSAGLATALAVIRARGVLGGRPGDRIVVTGGLTADGRVVPIGGADAKAVSARRAHACLFIVPVVNVADAARGAGAMPVAGVATLDDARRLIERGCPD
jgi:PDZ domain-containing secreted protein